MYFLDVGEWLLEHLWSLVDGMARHIFNFLCSFIYGLIIDLYNMFDHLCRARLLDNEVVSKISERIGLILGIIMLFFVIFAFIQMLLDPDKITDKTNGAVAVIKRTVLVVVMLGVSNFLFSTLYDVQRIVVESNVISKLLLPYTVDIATDSAGNNQFGSILAEEMFMAFYQMENLDEASLDDLSIDELNKINKCESIVNSLRNQIIFEYDFSLSRVCLQETINVKVNTNDGVEEQEISLINFNWFLAPIVGLFIAYFIFVYCISVGVRMVQLMFLEIVSPMAIVSYLSPKKDTMFSKWTKMYFSTYLDVFIRIAIINFVVFLISTILAVDAREGFIYWETLGNPANLKTKAFYSVIMVLALLTFAKKVPDLLKDLFPAGASKLGFGLKSPKAMFGDMLGGNLVRGAMVGAAGLGVGAAIGGVGNALRGAYNDKDNRLRGLFGGMVGGLASGGIAGAKAKGIGKAFGSSNKAAVEQSRRIAEWRANGGTSTWGRWGASMQHRLGLSTAGEKFEMEEQVLNDYIKAQDTIEGYAENNKVVKELKRKYEQIQNAGRKKIYDTSGNVIGEETDEQYNTRIEQARTDYKRAHQAVITAGMDNANRTASYTDSSGNVVNISVEDGVSESIYAASEKINRDVRNNKVLREKGYNTVSNYDEMDKQTIKARADVAKLTSSENYASSKADSKYSGSSKK